jgi:hypothetical protein
MSLQVFCHPDKIVVQPFCTGIIEAFRNHLKGMDYLDAVGATSLSPPWITSYLAMDQSKQRFAMIAGYFLHLIQ